MTRRSLCLSLAVLAAGCGFRLRTWELAAAFDTVRIEADSSVDLHRDLARALRSAGVRVVEADGEVVVDLSGQRDQRRSAAVTGSARAAEIELALDVAFAVAASDGRELIPSRVLRSERVVRLDRDNIVGSSEEQALLAAEMRDDLVGRMVRTLGALAQQAGRRADSD